MHTMAEAFLCCRTQLSPNSQGKDRDLHLRACSVICEVTPFFHDARLNEEPATDVPAKKGEVTYGTESCQISQLLD